MSTELSGTTSSGSSRDTIGNPTVTIEYKGLVVEQTATLVGATKKPAKTQLKVLNDLQGVVKPGRITLLLGPPKSGKTAFLKLLAGHLKPNKTTKVAGNLLYNGHAPSEFMLASTVGFVGQVDLHNPNLTVQETLQFAFATQHGIPIDHHKERAGEEYKDGAVVDAKAVGPLLQRVWEHPDKVAVITRLMGLHHCKDSLVGDPVGLVRGVSGGERKRLSMAEVLVGPRRALMLDEISTGLDSATLFSVIAWFAQAVHYLQLTVVTSLLQPPPEVFAMFDDVILLTSGLVLYHGPTNDIINFFGDIGFDFPPRKDLPSFLLEATTPAGQQKFAKPELVAMKAMTKQPSGMMLPLEEIASSFWTGNRHGQALRQALDQPFDKRDVDPRALAQHKYALTPYHLISLVTARQMKLTLRDKILLRGRLGQVTVMGLITGSLFYNLTPSLRNIGSIFGVCFIMTLFMAFGGLPQLPIVHSDKNVFYKHRNANMYPAYAQAWAMSISQLPLSTLDSVIYTILMYFLVGLYAKPSYFFTALVLLATNSAAVSGIFRLVGYIAPTLSAGNGLAGLMLLVFIVTSGFALVRTSIPYWWIWAYWVSPMATCFRGLVINELTSPAWDAPVYPGASLTIGRAALRTFTMFHERFWIWAAVGYMIGLFIITTVLSGLVLHRSAGPQSHPYVQDETALEAMRERARQRRAVLAAKQSRASGKPATPRDGMLQQCDSRSSPRSGNDMQRPNGGKQTLPTTVAPHGSASKGDPLGSPSAWMPPSGEHGTRQDLINAAEMGRLEPWRCPPGFDNRINAGSVELVQGTLVQVQHAASHESTMDGPGNAPGAAADTTAAIHGATATTETTSKAAAVAEGVESHNGIGSGGHGAAAANMAPGIPPSSEVLLVDSMAGSLPFQPITLVFKDIHYYVPNTKGVAVAAAQSEVSRRASLSLDPSTKAGKKASDAASNLLDAAVKAQQAAAQGEATAKAAKELEILKGVTGYCEPGRLLALMGGSGAGKTTLMDVLLGRKTIGRTTGSIHVNGHPKDQATWARVCGYVEQFDIHTGAQTVRWFVEEVMDIVDLVDIQNSLVGDSDSGGLSIEQRKRMTIAVELVANPSVVFMDEPTSGLDARAAAVVMKAVRNVARNGRTVMVTIHQPSIEIFEAFDDLVLLQRGGRVTYFGPLGTQSSELIRYLEGCGASKCTDGVNPATWMLEVTGGSMVTLVQPVEADFPELFRKSELAAAVERRADELVRQGAAEGGPLQVAGRYAAKAGVQLHELLRRWWKLYLRSPSYTIGRIMVGIVVGCIYASLFVNEGKFGNPVAFKNVQNLMGTIFSSVNFLGMSNLMQAMPIVGTERVVFYRERSSAMYEPFLYALSLALVEVPWWLGQTFTFVPIMYFAVGFTTNAGQFFYYLLMFFENLTFYTIFGQTMVYLTPTQPLGTVIAAALNFLFNIFNGFTIPYPNIAIGWKWMNRITPTTWVMYGLATNQMGAEQRPLLLPDQRTHTTLAKFIESYFGYEHSMRFWCLLIVAAYVMFFRVISVLALKYCNFYRR